MLQKSLCMLVLVSCFALFAEDIPSTKPYTTIIHNDDGVTFNIAVSLHSNPNEERRDHYEEVLTHMARGIWEMTNTGHRIGTVKIFQGGQQTSVADIVWQQNERPFADFSGLNSETGKIMVGDSYDDIDYLETPEGREALGYKLAREFARYTYAINYQYASTNEDDNEESVGITLPWYGDEPTISSIMNEPENALGGAYHWLNFDTYDTFEERNAHGRVWGINAWDLLLQDRRLDEERGRSSVQPRRRQFRESLQDKAPTETCEWEYDGETYSFMRVFLDDEDIIDVDFDWVEEDIEVVLIIDRSGSMSIPEGGSTRLELVQEASKKLVSLFPRERTAIGVTSFSGRFDEFIVEYNITPINGDGVVDEIHDAIDGIEIDDLTAIYDAAIHGLDLLNDYREDNETKAIRFAILLSDGADVNSEHSPEYAIRNYNNSQVPLFTYGYGPSSGFVSLNELATETGGHFFPNLIEEEEVRNSYTQAMGRATPTEEIPTGTNGTGGILSQNTLDLYSGNSFVFYAENSMSDIDVVIDYEIDDGGMSLMSSEPPTINFEIRDSNNNPIYPAPTVTMIGQSALLNIKSDAFASHGEGWWTVELNSSGDAQITNSMVLNHSAVKKPELTVENLTGTVVTYPEPFLIAASVSYGKRVKEMTVSATLQNPEGDVIPVELRDDGLYGDAIAQDGIYSAIFSDYDEDGIYILTVIANNYSDGSMLSQQNGTASISVPQFGRKRTLRIAVQGFMDDDHGNCPGTATLIALNDYPVPGKIDYAEDEDFFEVVTEDAEEDVIVRVSEMSHTMNAELTVFDDDGNTIGYTNINVGNTVNGYLALRVAASDLGERLFIRVNDLDEYESGAIYRVSAGTEKRGDEVVGSAIEVYIKDEGLHENNIVKPRMYLKNTGDVPISGFTVCYYFTAEEGKTPILADYHTPYSTLSLTHLGGNDYRVDYSYSVTLEPGQMLPDQSGNVIGIHYDNWAPMNKLNDFSNPGSSEFIATDRIAVFSNDGVLISGSYPIE
ncbi:VWA domain-containing protein [Chitinispirillales bacterium ANBcel5]|uniref:vWA domain-containing protein n=1 Tax=Cellulosispirillum alkaliphilum TaxID=3039283 RepID=UPI002A4EF27E|nr:VWA domain-containing protein [Chitinispirillales bacterium ANBcel5]